MNCTQVLPIRVPAKLSIPQQLRQRQVFSDALTQATNYNSSAQQQQPSTHAHAQHQPVSVPDPSPVSLPSTVPLPSLSVPKKKRKERNQLTQETKLKIIEAHTKQPLRRYKDIATEFSVDPSVVSRTIKSELDISNKLKQNPHMAKRVRMQDGEYPTIDKAILAFHHMVNKHHVS